MATAKPLLQRFALWLIATVKAQPLATALLFPIAVLGMQVHWQREDAQTLRTHTIEDNRLAQFQTSGKSLDEALAKYIEAVGTLGLADRVLAAPGAFEATPVPEARKALLTARAEAQKAIGQHANDLKALYGIVSQDASRDYSKDLANMTDIVDDKHNVLDIGLYTTTFGRLLKTRDELVDTRNK